MSPHYMIELEQLYKSIKELNREFHNAQHNDRMLVSRNKREGWYLCKLERAKVRKGGDVTVQCEFVRTRRKEAALRYRKQTGTQFFLFRNRKQVSSRTRVVK